MNTQIVIVPDQRDMPPVAEAMNSIGWGTSVHMARHILMRFAKQGGTLYVHQELIDLLRLAAQIGIEFE